MNNEEHFDYDPNKDVLWSGEDADEINQSNQDLRERIRADETIKEKHVFDKDTYTKEPPVNAEEIKPPSIPILPHPQVILEKTEEPQRIIQHEIKPSKLDQFLNFLGRLFRGKDQ